MLRPSAARPPRPSSPLSRPRGRRGDGEGVAGPPCCGSGAAEAGSVGGDLGARRGGRIPGAPASTTGENARPPPSAWPPAVTASRESD